MRSRLSCIVLALSLLQAPVPSVAGDMGWPREYFGEDGSSVLIHQPQVEEWEDNSLLRGEAAVRLKMSKEDEGTLGAAFIEADTATDLESRTVEIVELRVTDVKFPSVTPGEGEVLGGKLRALIPRRTVEISLDRILASLSREEIAARRIEVSNDPPKIVVSTAPAVLVALDGEPVLERAGDTDLLAAVNTEAFLFRRLSPPRWYLLSGEAWLESPDLEGPWAAVTELPEVFRRLPEGERWDEIRSLASAHPAGGGGAPRVVVSREPTELVVFDGEPRYSTVEGTGLLRASNTASDFFLSEEDGLHYFLVSGRWFRSAALDGPWEFCSEDLPGGFALLPEDEEAGRVLASVPGTGQNTEALIAAHIPRTARVSRNEAKLEVSYEGTPQFERIPGTEVEFATNTSFDVFHVAGRYYACFEGVWFCSGSPEGPWSLCEDIPEAIYGIPPTSPKHTVTYVYHYDSTPGHVSYGYYPGYVGTYFTGFSLVFGTGYRYRHPSSYYRHYWYRYPYPYYYGHHHVHRTYGRARHYDHFSGTYARGSRSGSYRGGKVTSTNPYGTWQGGSVQTFSSGSYGTWGSGVRAVEGPRGNAAALGAAAVAGAAGAAALSGRAARVDDDVYVGGRDTLWRKTEGDWQKYENGRWVDSGRVPPERKEAVRELSSYGAPSRSLERAARSRTSGARRPSQYGSYRSSYGGAGRSAVGSAPGRSGGGMRSVPRGGGGRRR